MASQKLEHYLRAYRRQSGLTQAEVAFLLGSKTRAKVSRYERRCHIPPLRTALAFAALFGAPVSEVFAGVRESVERDLRRRARTLARELDAQDAKRNPRLSAHKLQWLAKHCDKTPLGERPD